MTTTPSLLIHINAWSLLDEANPDTEEGLRPLIREGLKLWLEGHSDNVEGIGKFLKITLIKH